MSDRLHPIMREILGTVRAASVYDRHFTCIGEDCGADFATPYGTGEGDIVSCPHCQRRYTVADDADYDSERGWRDCSRLTEVDSRGEEGR